MEGAGAGVTTTVAGSTGAFAGGGGDGQVKPDPNGLTGTDATAFSLVTTSTPIWVRPSISRKGDERTGGKTTGTVGHGGTDMGLAQAEKHPYQRR